MNLIETKNVGTKFLKFGLVGLLGTAIDFSITFLLKDLLYQNLYVANAFGFFVAASGNFYLNSSWTFGRVKKISFNLYLTFIGISSIGLLFHTTIIYFIHQVLHLDFYLSKCMATIIVVVWNFGANYLFTFRKKSYSKHPLERFDLSDQIMPLK